MAVFQRSNILVPSVSEPEKWAVIACDQFTSDLQYWERVQTNVGGAPSSLNLIFPEAWLGGQKVSDRKSRVWGCMQEYLHNGVFTELRDSYIYIERRLSNGIVRRGVLGVVDLEEYSFDKNSNSAIRATEETVLERIPPRVDIRDGAALELPHVILLCNDESGTVIEEISAYKSSLRKLYGFTLMEGGGEITGWQIDGKYADLFDASLAAYYKRQDEYASRLGNAPVYFCMGDGNHSLAAAKACYERLKAVEGQAALCHPSRYALVELENLYDDSIVFDGIHRVIHMDKKDMPELLKALSDCEESEQGEVVPIKWYARKEAGTVNLHCSAAKLPIARVQELLDQFLANHNGTLDYIHGIDALKSLCQKEDYIGFEIPPIDKYSLFSGIAASGVLPRKAFSIGQAKDKRYYIEARKIRND